MSWHSRCWLLAEAPSNYPTKVGTVARTQNGKPPGSAWFNEETFNWEHVKWVQVENPKDMTREEWSAYVAELGLPDMLKKASA